MADTKITTGLIRRLSPFRTKAQTGATPADLAALADKMGYDVAVSKDGEVIPIPRDIGRDEGTGFSNKWERLWDQSGAKTNNRDARLGSYERMDSAGAEGAVVLDTYADETLTIVDSLKNSIQIQISDEKIRERVMQVLEANNVLTSAREDVRSLCKNGDFAYTIHAAQGSELVQIQEATAQTGVKIDRPIEPNNIFLSFVPATKYKVEASAAKIFKLAPNEAVSDQPLERDLKPWEFSFFSIRNRDTYPYGLSILEKMRIPFEQLTVLEQLLAVTRASRVDRIAVSVPGVGGDPASVLARLSNLKNTIKTIILGQSNSNQRVTRNQDYGMTEYLWVPAGFDVKKLATSIEAGTVDDVNYFRDKLYNASRMPKGFFLADDGQGATRPMTLKQQDIKFARTLIPVSEAYCLGLRQLILLIAFYVGGDLSTLKVEVSIKKSPYISSELVQSYQDVMSLINTYVSLHSQGGSEAYKISRDEIRRICSLVGAPFELVDASATPDSDPSVISSLYESVTAHHPLRVANLLDVCRQ
jgi:hypothetical protein